MMVITRWLVVHDFIVSTQYKNVNFIHVIMNVVKNTQSINDMLQVLFPWYFIYFFAWFFNAEEDYAGFNTSQIPFMKLYLADKVMLSEYGPLTDGVIGSVDFSLYYMSKYVCGCDDICIGIQRNSVEIIKISNYIYLIDL